MSVAAATRVFTVMLVSVDPAFSAVMHAMIGTLPDHALAVCDLAAARRTLQSLDPTIVLVDADSMPAPESAVSLMTLCARAPVVAVSAARRLSPADTTALYKAGAVSVLFKTGGSSGIALLRENRLLAQLHMLAGAQSERSPGDRP